MRLAVAAMFTSFRHRAVSANSRRQRPLGQTRAHGGALLRRVPRRVPLIQRRRPRADRALPWRRGDRPADVVQQLTPVLARHARAGMSRRVVAWNTRGYYGAGATARRRCTGRCRRGGSRLLRRRWPAGADILDRRGARPRESRAHRDSNTDAVRSDPASAAAARLVSQCRLHVSLRRSSLASENRVKRYDLQRRLKMIETEQQPLRAACTRAIRTPVTLGNETACTHSAATAALHPLT